MCSVFLKDKLTGYFFHLIVLSKNMCGSSTLIASQKLRPLFIGVEKFTHCLRILRQINCKRSLNFREQKITVCIHAWNRTLLQGFRISKSLKMINIFLKLFTGCLKNYPIMKLFIKYHLIPYSSSNFWFNFFSRFFKSIKAAPYQIWSYFLTRLVVKQPINITPDKTLIKPIVCRELK